MSRSKDNFTACHTQFLNLHSSYYSDFFLLRTPININGRLADIKIVKGEPSLVTDESNVKLSTISLKCMDPVLLKHGVYHINTFYYEKVPLYSVSFRFKSSLKRFLSNREDVQRELASTIATKVKLMHHSRFQSTGTDYTINVDILVQVYLVSPNTPRSPACQVTLSNYRKIAQRLENSKQFDFNDTMFVDGPTIGKTNIIG